MGLTRARNDWNRFITGGGFEVDLTFRTPSGSVTKTVKGLGIKHHLSIDNEGVSQNQLNAHVTVSEKTLVDAGYPVRDGNEIVALKDHIVSFEDSTGIESSYIITQSYPDETVGVIVCIIGEFNG